MSDIFHNMNVGTPLHGHEIISNYDHYQASKGKVEVDVSSKNGKATGTVHGNVTANPTDNSKVNIHGKADTRGNKEVGIGIEITW